MGRSASESEVLPQPSRALESFVAFHAVIPDAEDPAIKRGTLQFKDKVIVCEALDCQIMLGLDNTALVPLPTLYTLREASLDGEVTATITINDNNDGYLSFSDKTGPEFSDFVTPQSAHDAIIKAFLMRNHINTVIKPHKKDA
ncbi:MAG: hypothetical protein JWN33_374 [Candidatus Saccharibacteria bacterium]|nr:hypothetical protein [Candidatus Saccharibacteria bacterium]